MAFQKCMRCDEAFSMGDHPRKLQWYTIIVDAVKILHEKAIANVLMCEKCINTLVIPGIESIIRQPMTIYTANRQSPELIKVIENRNKEIRERIVASGIYTSPLIDDIIPESQVISTEAIKLPEKIESERYAESPEMDMVIFRYPAEFINWGATNKWEQIDARNKRVRARALNLRPWESTKEDDPTILADCVLREAPIMPQETIGAQ